MFNSGKLTMSDRCGTVTREISDEDGSWEKAFDTIVVSNKTVQVNF